MVKEAQMMISREILYGNSGEYKDLKFLNKTKNLEGVQKKCTNILLHTTKMIDPRVESQARGQNNLQVSKLVSFIAIQGFLLRYTSPSHVNSLLYGAMSIWKLRNCNLFDRKMQIFENDGFFLVFLS